MTFHIVSCVLLPRRYPSNVGVGKRLIAGYIAHDQDNGRDHTVREPVAEFRGLSGSAKQKKVLDATGLHRAPLSKLVTRHRQRGSDSPAHRL